MGEGRTSDPKSLERVLKNLSRFREKFDKGVCNCCKRTKTLRRGLCLRCYNNVELRKKHLDPVRLKRGVGLDGGGRTLGEPTQARPGTEEKIQVLERRAELKQALFQPGDYDPRHEFDPEIGVLARFLKSLSFYSEEEHAEI